MSIETTGSSSQLLDFGVFPAGFTRMVNMLWIYRNDNLRGNLVSKFNAAVTTGWAASIEDAGGGSMRLYWRYYWTPPNGLWHSNSVVPTGLVHLAIDYSKSLTTNDPRMWINGVLQAVTEDSTPVGSATSDANSLGLADVPGVSDSFYGINGRYLSYDLIDATSLTDEQVNALVAESYNGKLAHCSKAAFSPNLCKADGLSTFDGGTIGSSNFIYDQVSGAKATPSGSPIARADNVLIHQGVN